ncbi:MAG: hypothetical protein B6241_03945 [Spirochaetaceae bacterium 4572_59]|nr:MAG: hypothetical protein B6241_03945 [Spirochaetaceae bacterium 4572_59]
MYKLDQPLYLLLLLLLPFFVMALYKKPKGLLFSAFQKMPEHKSWRIRLLVLPSFFYILAFIGIILTLARPVYYKGNVRDIRNGIVMEMVLDRSGSMGTWMDKKKERNRLDIVKSVFLDFVEARSDDIIGLTVFARYADTLSPLTVSHDVFPQFIKTVNLAPREADGTAIGDAIALAVARIESFRRGNPEGEKQSALIILLTDGQNNKGNLTPSEASKLAADRNITIYTIGFGGGFYQNAFGFWEKIPSEYQMDTKTLTEIAHQTGGLYFNADDEASLRKIYDRIDKLEKTEVEKYSFTERHEYFQIFLIISMILLVIAIVLGELFFPLVENEI